jgi:excisionase family DNA binding protein
MSTPQTMTTAEVCAALRCSRASLYRAMARGEVPQPRKLGKRNRWPADALAKALNKLPSELIDTSKAVEARQRKRRGFPGRATAARLGRPAAKQEATPAPGQEPVLTKALREASGAAMTADETRPPTRRGANIRLERETCHG